MKNHFYSNTFTLVVFLTGTLLSLKAQVPNPVSFNTAVNAGLNGTIPLGSNDLSWTTSSISINGPYVPAVRASNQLAWLISPYTTANWITYPHYCTTNPVEHLCVGSVDEYYKLTFALPSIACNDSIKVTGGYCLTMNYFADNYVSEIFVNGISSFVNTSSSGPYSANGFSAGTGATVTICNNWQPGTNTLIVHVKSGPPTTGFLAFITATATTPGGYSVTATQSNVSCYNFSNGSATVNLNGYSGPATYTWLPFGGNGPSAANLTPGIYTVNIQMPLCNQSTTLSVTQPASFAVNVSTTQPICKGTKATFTASGAESYSWSPGSISGSTATLNPISTTVYTVFGTDAQGCKSSSLFTLQVLPCTGLSENNLKDLKILCSSSGNLWIETRIDHTYKVEIFDLTGRLKYSGNVNQTSEIDVNNLSAGIYLLYLSNQTSSVRKKILISK